MNLLTLFQRTPELMEKPLVMKNIFTDNWIVICYPSNIDYCNDYDWYGLLNIWETENIDSTCDGTTCLQLTWNERCKYLCWCRLGNSSSCGWNGFIRCLRYEINYFGTVAERNDRSAYNLLNTKEIFFLIYSDYK